MIVARKGSQEGSEIWWRLIFELINMVHNSGEGHSKSHQTHSHSNPLSNVWVYYLYQVPLNVCSIKHNKFVRRKKRRKNKTINAIGIPFRGFSRFSFFLHSFLSIYYPASLCLACYLISHYFIVNVLCYVDDNSNDVCWWSFFAYYLMFLVSFIQFY